MTNVIERLRNKANILAQNSEPVNRPPPLSPMKAKRSPKHVWKISEFNDLELARQLCLIEHDFLMYVLLNMRLLPGTHANFREISEKDLHNLNWTSKSKSKVLVCMTFNFLGKLRGSLLLLLFFKFWFLTWTFRNMQISRISS